MTAEKITTNQGVLNVPNNPIVRYYHILVEYLNAAVKYRCSCEKHNGERKSMEVLAGKKHDETGEWLPAETLDTIREYLIIKGPLTT